MHSGEFVDAIKSILVYGRVVRSREMENLGRMREKRKRKNLGARGRLKKNSTLKERWVLLGAKAREKLRHEEKR